MNGRGAQRASGRTACLVRRHAADSCDKRDVPAEPTNDATRERSTRSEQGSEQDGANDTRANANTRTRSTRKRRHTCDLSRGTATTEPFQTSTSRRVSSSRSSRRSKPSCRPATSPSHYSLSLSPLSSLLFPSYCTSIILLPPFHRSQISLFFYRYSHFCHPCRSSVCWFVRPFVHSVIGSARIFVRFVSSIREFDEFPYPREYYSPPGKHRRQFLWEKSRRDHRLPYGEHHFDRGCLVEAREIVSGTLINIEAPS